MKRPTPQSSSRSGEAISKPRATAVAWTASTSATSTEMPGAARSSLPMMVTCAEALAGDARVMTQPRSITTSKPRSTKKSRVAAGRSDLTFGTALLIAMSDFYRTAHSPDPHAPGRLASELRARQKRGKEDEETDSVHAHC